MVVSPLSERGSAPNPLSSEYSTLECAGPAHSPTRQPRAALANTAELQPVATTHSHPWRRLPCVEAERLGSPAQTRTSGRIPEYVGRGRAADSAEQTPLSSGKKSTSLLRPSWILVSSDGSAESAVRSTGHLPGTELQGSALTIAVHVLRVAW